MGILAKTKTYLAGNMEVSADAISWRTRITESFKKLDIICLDPTMDCLHDHPSEDEAARGDLKKKRSEGRLDEVAAYMKQVVRRDLRMVDYADFVIFNLEPKHPTFGTIHELVLATQQRKPVLLRCDRKEVPLWVLGMVNPAMIFNEEKEIVDYLTFIDTGVIKPDPKYWKFLKPEFR